MTGVEFWPGLGAVTKVFGVTGCAFIEPRPTGGMVFLAANSSGLTSRYGFATLKSMIRDMRQYSHVPAATLKVHSRFSFPLSPVVLLLVGLPFVMDPHSKSFVKGLIFCFLLAVGYYLTHFACIDFGNIGYIPPIIAAWFPVATFGAVGIVAFARMKT